MGKKGRGNGKKRNDKTLGFGKKGKNGNAEQVEASDSDTDDTSVSLSKQMVEGLSKMPGMPNGEQPPKAEWSVKHVRDLKRERLENAKKGKGNSVFNQWGEGALHHKISKETLAGLIDELGLIRAANQAPGKPGREGALRFWRACCHAAGDAVVKQSMRKDNLNPFKVLWNIPMNLAIGPEKRVGDPGTQFDPDTNEGLDGKRAMDRISSLLKEIEDKYSQLREKVGAEKFLTSDREWNELTALLLKAFEAYTDLLGDGDGHHLALPTDEQWVLDQTTGSSQRKGLRKFPTIKEGIQRFEDGRKYLRDISSHIGGKATAAKEARTCTLNGNKLPVEVVLDEAALAHICQRHTYTYFTPVEIKAINNFWPLGTTYESLAKEIGAMMPDIATMIASALERLFPEGLEKGEEALTLENQIAHDVAIFLIAKARNDGDKIVVTLETVSPDGPEAEAYTAGALAEICAKLGPEFWEASGTKAPSSSSSSNANPAPPSSAEPPPPGEVSEFKDDRWAKRAPKGRRTGAPSAVSAAVKNGDFKNGDYVRINDTLYRLTFEGSLDLAHSIQVEPLPRS